MDPGRSWCFKPPDQYCRKRIFYTLQCADGYADEPGREKLMRPEVIKNYSEEKLHKIFEQYGEVTNSKTLAKTIVELRKSNH